jgi:hypothetical protein
VISRFFLDLAALFLLQNLGGGTTSSRRPAYSAST